MTADRVAHYQQVTGGPRDQSTIDDTDQTGPARSLQSLLPHLNTSLPLSDRMHGHQQVSTCYSTSYIGHTGAASDIFVYDALLMYLLYLLPALQFAHDV